jgi:hypothetical protein
MCFLWGTDNNCDSYINTPLSRTYRYYYPPNRHSSVFEIQCMTFSKYGTRCRSHHAASKSGQRIPAAKQSFSVSGTILSGKQSVLKSKFTFITGPLLKLRLHFAVCAELTHNSSARFCSLLSIVPDKGRQTGPQSLHFPVSLCLQ